MRPMNNITYKIIASYRISGDDAQRYNEIYSELEKIAQTYGGVHDATTSTYLFSHWNLAGIKKDIMDIYIEQKITFDKNDSLRLFVMNTMEVHSIKYRTTSGTIFLRWDRESFDEYMGGVN